MCHSKSWNSDMEFRRKVCLCLDSLPQWPRICWYLLLGRTLRMSETVTDHIAWWLLLVDLWQVYAVSCFFGLLQRLLNSKWVNWQWALACCLRKWLLGPRIAMEMREAALDELCEAVGSCILEDEHILAVYPASQRVAIVLIGIDD